MWVILCELYSLQVASCGTSLRKQFDACLLVSSADLRFFDHRFACVLYICLGAISGCLQCLKGPALGSKKMTLPENPLLTHGKWQPPKSQRFAAPMPSTVPMTIATLVDNGSFPAATKAFSKGEVPQFMDHIYLLQRPNSIEKIIKL